MLKIGEFARICNVSPQTLRYYDEQGILCPDATDPISGYRYYTPAQIESYRRIQTYKDAGFSLEEIKELMYGDPARFTALMAMKRNEISTGVKILQNKLSLLESLSRQQASREEVDLYDQDEPFVDHPEVLGVWELCGQIMAPVEGEFPDYRSPVEPCSREDVCERLVFLPDGATWWMYCWTRGRLFWLSEIPRTRVPNPYVLWETEEGRYMTMLCYATVPCLHRGEPPIWLLYRQTKEGPLTEEESRTRVDETDLPLLPDPEVLGEWEAVAFVRSTARFSRRSIPKKRVHLWILGVTFGEDNGFIRHVAWAGHAADWPFTYTRYESPTAEARGTVLNKRKGVAEEYFLREVDGEEFLFIQHKSGDYIYGGRKPVWYVFRRALSNTNNKTKSGR